MGRTIPSFRLASVEEEREWKVFRNALDKSDRRILDEMFSIPHLYNSERESIDIAVSCV
ncbi:MAG: hypothetical protein M3P08_19555 [Thermoproteota archaeon]|nr:hypothetical protein [Thermoproteota archaeon]